MDRIEFAKTVKQLRRRIGLCLSKFDIEVGTTAITVKRCENERVPPSPLTSGHSGVD